MSDKTKLTPVMQQYVDIKAENPDALLLLRLGDFYEVFFEDAAVVSKTLGLVLTSRGNDGIPMCGVPWHAAENYIGRLVRAGFSVALVEQLETPEQAKAAGHKQIERGVARIITPGTLTDENLLSPKSSNFLVAVCGRPGGAFDIAGCDISTGEFFIGTSSNILDDMVRVAPAEIIYPEKSAEDNDVIVLRNAFKTTPVYEKLYNRTDINQIVSKVFGNNLECRVESLELRESALEQSSKLTGNCSNLDNLNSQLYTLNSAIALLAGYLFNTQRDANIAFRAPYAFRAGKQLLIDSATWKSLEIDAPLHDGGECLATILDKTATAAGARRLRSYLRTLSGDIGEIRRRQEHIGHLLLNRDVRGELSGILSRIPDVGRALSRLLAARGTPRDMRQVADFMVSLPDVKSVGARLDDDLKSKFSKINVHDALAGELKFALSDELPTFFRDGGVIRAGFDVSLDNMRSLANGARTTIAALQAEYASQSGVNTLKIKYNNILGYFIEVPSARADSLMKPDSGFIHRQTMAGNMRFTTARLIDLDNEVRSAAEKSAAIENEIIAALIEKIRIVANDLLNTAELIADADVWCSLAGVAEECEWVRPDVTGACEFNVVGGRHPVIEWVLRRSGNQFVKNDCNLGTGEPGRGTKSDSPQSQIPSPQKCIALLTGPNMAGKSTYLRQNALIVVLAHLGSFVPATAATIGICDQLFSRVGASDNLAAGQSTFMVEMVETANILNRATKQSFIIFDEIGRGTATYDGMAIAQAVLEFVSDMSPRTLFATHYHELTALKLSAVQCMTIEVREHNNDIIFMHKIVSGVANRSYGIHVAKMAGLPKSVVERAEHVLAGLESTVVKSVEIPASFVVNEPGVKPKIAEPAKKSQLSLFG